LFLFYFFSPSGSLVFSLASLLALYRTEALESSY